MSFCWCTKGQLQQQQHKAVTTLLACVHETFARAVCCRAVKHIAVWSQPYHRSAEPKKKPIAEDNHLVSATVNCHPFNSFMFVPSEITHLRGLIKKKFAQSFSGRRDLFIIYTRVAEKNAPVSQFWQGNIRNFSFEIAKAITMTPK